MRKKTLQDAKLVIRVESKKGEDRITTESVFDNRTGEYWNDEQIAERNIRLFLNIEDLKETLNWNLNGDSSKYQFKWGITANRSEGVAYIFQ